jgi:hypothetical protein
MKLSWGNFAIAYLQLLHPVLTFGRLALLALADLELAEIILVLFRPYTFLANHPLSHCCPRYQASFRVFGSYLLKS